jgi:hypothetical protein
MRDVGSGQSRADLGEGELFRRFLLDFRGHEQKLDQKSNTNKSDVLIIRGRPGLTKWPWGAKSHIPISGLIRSWRLDASQIPSCHSSFTRIISGRVFTPSSENWHCPRSVGVTPLHGDPFATNERSCYT